MTSAYTIRLLKSACIWCRNSW